MNARHCKCCGNATMILVDGMRVCIRCDMMTLWPKLKEKIK